MSSSLRAQGRQHARLPSPLSPGVCSNSCPLSRWCPPTIPSSVASFSSWLQSFPASGSFPISWLFTSGGQSNGVSASASVLPMNIQGWFPYDWLVWSPCSLSLYNFSCCICLFQVAFLYFLFWFLNRKMLTITIVISRNCFVFSMLWKVCSSN